MPRNKAIELSGSWSSRRRLPPSCDVRHVCRVDALAPLFGMRFSCRIGSKKHDLEQKYSWCHVPEISSGGFFLEEKACRAGCFTLQ